MAQGTCADRPRQSWSSSRQGLPSACHTVRSVSPRRTRHVSPARSLPAPPPPPPPRDPAWPAARPPPGPLGAPWPPRARVARGELGRTRHGARTGRGGWERVAEVGAPRRAGRRSAGALAHVGGSRRLRGSEAAVGNRAPVAGPEGQACVRPRVGRGVRGAEPALAAEPLPPSNALLVAET